MGKVILYIAISLDGYIAEPNGEIDFLNEYTSDNDVEYEKFYDMVDVIIMGNTTYVQIINKLHPNTWIYADKRCYVYTRDKKNKQEGVTFTNQTPELLINEIKQYTDKDIWLLGGGEIVKMFIEKNLIDNYLIYVMPIVLGKGIPLFPQNTQRTRLQFIGTRIFDYCKNVVELSYEKIP